MKFLVVSVLLLIGSVVSAQTPVDVYKGTVNIPPVSEDTMYFSFAKGDQLVFDFESTTGRELMEFEILQYPHYSKFRKDNKVTMKAEKMAIEQTGVYWFRMANRSATERNCKLHIWRIPASASTKTFKTAVAWKSVSDTTYTPATEKYIARRDTGVINRELAMTVHGTQSPYSPSQSPGFDLPDNTIAWSFYVGVNKPGQQPFQEATQKFEQSNNSSSAKIAGYGPLAALALTGKSSFTPIQQGQTINYSIVDATNIALAQQEKPFKSFRAKKVVNDFAAMKQPPSGKVYFYLLNDNIVDLDVMVKIAAVVVYEHTEERQIQKREVLRHKIPMVK